jgi:hypothetical protein
MPGLSGTNFSSGFLGSFANALESKRQLDLQKDQRTRQNFLSAAQSFLQQGYTPEEVQPFLAGWAPEIFGDKAQKPKAGQANPAQIVTDVLSRAHAATGGADALGRTVSAPTGPDVLGRTLGQSAPAPLAGIENPQPGGALDTGAPVAPPPQPPPQAPGRTLTIMGQPFNLLSPESLAQRQSAIEQQQLRDKVERARAIYPTLKAADPSITMKDALDLTINKQFLRSGVGSGVAFQSVAGEAPDENGDFQPMDAAFDRASGQYLNPITREPIQGFRKVSAARNANERFFGKDLESLSRGSEFGGKSYASQPPDVKDKINAALLKQQQDQAGATATARGKAQIQTELEKPIGTAAGQQYNLPPTTPLKDLMSTPGMTEAEKSKITSLSMADDSVQQINDLITKVFPDVKDRSPLMARGLTALDLAQKNFARDGDYVKLNSEISLAAINIARIAGETGRVPVQLVDKAQKALADLSLTGGDTRESALAKLDVVKELLKSARTNAPGGTATKPGASTTTTSSAWPQIGPDGHTYLNGKKID